jgi:hypothetical protein
MYVPTVTLTKIPINWIIKLNSLRLAMLKASKSLGKKWQLEISMELQDPRLEFKF